jgi:hypothetical protein
MASDATAATALVEVSSQISFDADIRALERDHARAEFEAEFRLGIATALGDGRAVQPDQVRPLVCLGWCKRCRCGPKISVGLQVTIREIRGPEMVVEFSVDVEVAEGDRVMGLLQELRGSGAALCVPVGMRRLIAMTVTMTEPLKRAGPVLSLMHGTCHHSNHSLILKLSFSKRTVATRA